MTTLLELLLELVPDAVIAMIESRVRQPVLTDRESNTGSEIERSAGFRDRPIRERQRIAPHRDDS